MSKTAIRIVAILITLATVGVIAFQISWLRQISKEKLRQDINNILDDAIPIYKSQKADSARRLLKMLVRTDKDFGYRYFETNKGLDIGIHGVGRATYAMITVNPADTAAINSDPYRYLMKRIDAMTFDQLHPFYSILVGTKDYPENSAEGKIAWDLMLKFEEVYQDTTAIKKVLTQRLIAAGIPFNGSLTYLEDPLALFSPPLERTTKGQPSNSEIYEAPFGYGHISLSHKMARLNKYIDSLNHQNGAIYVGKSMLFNMDATLGSKVPTLVLKVDTPPGLLIKKMAGNIIASALLVLCVGLCMIYMLCTIIKQKKLAEIKNDFISNISHELKTPVATALAAVQGMQYFDVLKDPAKTNNYLNTAEAEIKRLGVMVNKIINISIFENKGFNLNPVTFNFKQLLTDIASSQNIRQEKQISIELNYQAREELFADRIHIQNVMINLIDNAFNYSGDKVDIKIDCVNAGPELQIRVSDNGMGIAPEYQKQIFDKFFRVPRSGNVKGHGLGLNYVKHIVEKHHGSIILERSGAAGSTFMISLPG